MLAYNAWKFKAHTVYKNGIHRLRCSEAAVGMVVVELRLEELSEWRRLAKKKTISISDFEPTFWDCTIYHTRPIVEAERKPIEGKMAQEEEVQA